MPWSMGTTGDGAAFTRQSLTARTRARNILLSGAGVLALASVARRAPGAG